MLIVEHDHDECAKLAAVLRTFANTVTCVADPISAMESLRDGCVDVMILGESAGISAESFLRRMRALATGKSPSFATVRVHSDTRLASTSDHALFDVVLARPLTAVKLVYAVRRAHDMRTLGGDARPID